MIDKIMALFSPDESAQDKVNIFTEILNALFSYIFGKMGIEE